MPPSCAAARSRSAAARSDGSLQANGTRPAAASRRRCSRRSTTAAAPWAKRRRDAGALHLPPIFLPSSLSRSDFFMLMVRRSARRTRRLSRACALYSRPMAQKATVCKATLQIADIDRGLYADHALTVARHPSETDERMMVRLLAFALCVPADDRDGAPRVRQGHVGSRRARALAEGPHRPHRPVDRGRPARGAAPRQGERPRRAGQRVRLRRLGAVVVGRPRRPDRARRQHRGLAHRARAEPRARRARRAAACSCR